MSHRLKICSAACAGLCCVASQARAAIVCDGNFQIVDGMSVSTPYCQDETLAAAWRAHGFKISGAQVRRSPELKREICVSQASASDTSCADYIGD
jgi:hypothetical protein